MRRLIHIMLISLLLSLLISCGESIRTPQLLVAERIVENNPDSALSILTSLKPDGLQNDDERMLRRLLILQANDLNYIVQKDDEEIKALLHYFIDNKRLKRIHPLVYYYAGRTYADLKEDAKALGYFKKSLSILDPNENPSLESKIRSQMGGLYRYHKLFNHSLKEFRAFIEIARINKDTADIIGGQLNVAHIFALKQQPDSAEIVYKNLESLVKSFNDSVLITTFYSQWGSFRYERGNSSLADSLINLYPDKTDAASAQSVKFIRDKINGSNNKTVCKEDYIQLTKSEHPANRYSGNMGLARMSQKEKNSKNSLHFVSEAYTNLQEIQKMYTESSLAEMEKIIDETEISNDNLQLKK